MMPKPERQGNIPTIHRLLNKLSIIIGNCDLLIERVEGSEHTHRLEVIRDVAKTAVDDLLKTQRESKGKMPRTEVGKELKAKHRMNPSMNGNNGAHDPMS